MRYSRFKLRLIASLIALLRLGSSHAVELQPIIADPDAVHHEFIAAMLRIRSHLPDTEDSALLAAYPLHDYLVAARLRRDLTVAPSSALDESIDTFLLAHGAQPVARGLRHDWLASLADRRRWDWFLPRSVDVTDALLICDRLAGRLATGDSAGLSTAALARWILPQKQPAECDGVFAWLKQQGLLTPGLAETRARAALAAGNAHLGREFAADVPPARAVALLEWSDLLEAPRSALNVLATHPALPVEPDALAAGFEKLARIDPTGASDLLPSLSTRVGANLSLLQKMKRAIALGAAYDRDPLAIDAFTKLSVEDGDTQTQEWRVRAALWGGDFHKALAWIDLMPAALSSQPRWRYWRARAVAENSGAESAAPLFAEIAGLRDFYGYLAADKLNQGYRLNAKPSADDTGLQSQLAAELGLIRAHELLYCNMTDEAGLEWAAVVQGADSATKVQAARLASSWGWYAQAIATLAQTGEWDDVRLRYPRPFADAVAEASALAQVPADWIYGVMRQESLYRKDAVSRADARGLMQMLPATAVLVARRWHLPAPRSDSLFDPSESVPLGAAYLRELLDRYSGQLALSLSAYNAGPIATARWLPFRTMSADVWIENIPYNETRAYVQHILEHIVAFAYVRDAEPPRLETLLPAVTPSPAAPVVNP